MRVSLILICPAMFPQAERFCFRERRLFLPLSSIKALSSSVTNRRLPQNLHGNEANQGKPIRGPGKPRPGDFAHARTIRHEDSGKKNDPARFNRCIGSSPNEMSQRFDSSLWFQTWMGKSARLFLMNLARCPFQWEFCTLYVDCRAHFSIPF